MDIDDFLNPNLFGNTIPDPFMLPTPSVSSTKVDIDDFFAKLGTTDDLLNLSSTTIQTPTPISYSDLLGLGTSAIEKRGVKRARQDQNSKPSKKIKLTPLTFDEKKELEKLETKVNLNFILSLTTHIPMYRIEQGKPLSLGGFLNFISAFGSCDYNTILGSRCYSTRSMFERYFSGNHIEDIKEKELKIDNLLGFNDYRPKIITVNVDVKKVNRKKPSWVGHTFVYLYFPEIDPHVLFKCQSYIYSYDLRIKMVNLEEELKLINNITNKNYVKLFGHKPVVGPTNIIPELNPFVYGVENKLNFTIKQLKPDAEYTTLIDENYSFDASFSINQFTPFQFEEFNSDLTLIINNYETMFKTKLEGIETISPIFKRAPITKENLNFIVNQCTDLIERLFSIANVSVLKPGSYVELLTNPNLKIVLENSYEDTKYDLFSILLSKLYSSSIEKTHFSTKFTSKIYQVVTLPINRISKNSYKNVDKSMDNFLQKIKNDNRNNKWLICLSKVDNGKMDLKRYNMIIYCRRDKNIYNYYVYSESYYLFFTTSDTLSNNNFNKFVNQFNTSYRFIDFFILQDMHEIFYHLKNVNNAEFRNTLNIIKDYYRVMTNYLDDVEQLFDHFTYRGQDYSS